MSKRSVLAILLTLFLVLGALAGCSGGGEPASGGDTPPADTPSDNGAPPEDTPETPGGGGDGATLQFWSWLAIDDLVADYSADKDYEIEHVQMAHADIMNKLTVALSANTGAPDLFQMTHRHFSNFSTTGKLYDMTGDVSDVIGDFPQSLLELVSLDGKVYGLAADISPAVLWYRRDIFTEHGIATPLSTWSDYEAAAETLKAQGVYVMPVFNPAGTWGANAVGMFLGTRGGNIFTPDGAVIRDNADLEFVLQYFYDMDQQGYGESISFFTPEFWGELKAGKIASWPMNMAEGANIKSNMPELEGEWGVMPIPRWDDLDTAYTGFWGGTVVSIPEESAHKAEAVEFLKWLCATDEGQLAASRTWNAVPALPTAYDDPFYGEGDPYWGGDNPYDMINDTNPFFYYDWSIAEKHIGEQTDLMFAGRITPTEAARAIEENIAAETGR